MSGNNQLPFLGDSILYMSEELLTIFAQPIWVVYGTVAPASLPLPSPSTLSASLMVATTPEDSNKPPPEVLDQEDDQDDAQDDDIGMQENLELVQEDSGASMGSTEEFNPDIYLALD